MADKDIIQNMIAQLGQSQAERMSKELEAGFIGLDERSTADLMAFAREFSRFVRFYPPDGGEPSDWSQFFDYDDAAIQALAGATSGDVPPHLALFLAFLEIYRKPLEVLNGITGRHLDFYYRDVLRLFEKPPVPDRAHLLLEVKKAAPPVRIGMEHLFSAGKDAAGAELLYAPVRESIVSAARVDSIRSNYLDRSGHGVLRHAPIADSSDGLGGKFKGEPQWSGLGGGHLPPGQIGFALASPVLRMKEGNRSVRIRLTLGSADRSRLNAAALGEAFEAFITGEKGWLGPFLVSATLSAGSVLELRFVLAGKEPAVVDYAPAAHGGAYASGAPVVQLLLREENTAIGYLDFETMTLAAAAISVEVSGVESLVLESDAGMLDPRKAFLPFGPQPAIGSRFLMSYPEALSKKIERLSISVQWKDLPASGQLGTHYGEYGIGQIDNSYFTAGVSFRDGAGREFSGIWHLFNTGNALQEQEVSFSSVRPQQIRPLAAAITGSRRVEALVRSGSSFALREADRYLLRSPVLFQPLPSFRPPLPPARDGVITVVLNTGFFHALYRTKFVQKVLESSRAGGTFTPPNEPYTPAVQSIRLSYSASSDTVSIASAAVDDFAGGDVAFYHVAPTGSRREHGYLRQRLELAAERGVTLLPSYRHDGELLIGLTGIGPGDSVSLLVEVAEGTADPDLPPEKVEWFVLCDNYWKPLGASELVLDTTNNLLASGIVTILIPAGATADNTILPAGRIWIKAGVRRRVAAINHLMAVAANAVEVRFMEKGNDPDHLVRPLAAGSITRMKNGIAPVKSVSQPYPSFGGAPAESSAAFHTRVAERLRHKNRCVTSWDYERVVLEAFPRVHRAKCIPHAREGSWSAPGHVLVVVVPDIRNRTLLDPLAPRLDADTMSRIARHLRQRSGMGVKIGVKNPRYQKIRLDFKVRFHKGYEFNYYRAALEQELIRALSPWAFDASREVSFGGAIYKSVLLDVVEDLGYVDYITDFKMYSYSGTGVDPTDRSEVRAETPDMILVSDAGHTITEIPG